MYYIMECIPFRFSYVFYIEKAAGKEEEFGR